MLPPSWWRRFSTCQPHAGCKPAPPNLGFVNPARESKEPRVGLLPSAAACPVAYAAYRPVGIGTGVAAGAPDPEDEVVGLLVAAPGLGAGAGVGVSLGAAPAS